jgi:YgiT-type zinc finger domain-containing protein
MDRPSEAEEIDDLCLCGRGRLKEEHTKIRVKVEGTLLVIKNVPARVCSLCDEAYVSPETSRQIDEITAKYRAGGLAAKPIPAGEIDRLQTA